MSAGAQLESSTFKQPNALPQYGFSTDVSFASLVDGNPFLFRVYTPKSQPLDNADPHFLGTSYHDEFSSATFQSAVPSMAPASKVREATYADVVRHLDWTTRSSSPYISASFSFAWAVWEAIRRYHFNVKHDVEIAVIDARAVSDRTVTAVEVLMKGSPQERHKDHWKFHRFAVEAQDALVWGYIPGSAVLASIPILQIVSRLPSYFLASDSPDLKSTPLGRLGWDYTSKKPNFRQFCQTMSDRFLRNPIDRRLRDTTAGSVRLAICLLRPYIHKHVSGDFAAATAHVSELAYVIACWPGQWAREHPEISDLVKCIVHVVGEEMKESKRAQASTDASRMQEIVGGLEQLAKSYEKRERDRMFPPSLPLTPKTQSPFSSPPGSPTVGSLIWSTASLSTLSAQESKSIQTDLPTPPSSEPPSPIAAPTSPSPPVADPISPTPTHAKPEIITPDDLLAPTVPLLEEVPHITESNERSIFSDVLARTASCFMTGFFIGSFITLCVFSTHRRELAHHLT